MSRFLHVVICASVLCAPVLAGAGPAERTVVRPKDTGAALVNPQMGWTFHFSSNVPEHYGGRLAPSDTLEDFPGLAVIYIRLPWAFIEPEEGRFEWSMVDAPAQRWIDHGKRIALRFSCTETWLEYATPRWVEEAGARGHRFRPGTLDPAGPFFEPDYADPIFLDKLESFLRAVAARYDGSPHVDFIDVGSFGVWGEGHTFSSTRLYYPPAVLRKHIDLHARLFEKTLLAVNDDFAFFGPPGTELDISRYPGKDTIRYAFEKGLTLRDDSILVQPPPRQYFSAGLADLFWRSRPVILECQHYGPSRDSGAWGDGHWYMQAVEDYHASYVSIHWWPREFLREQRDLITRINRRLGYRLRLVEASWPSRVEPGEEFEVELRWANAGVAPCYPGGHGALTLEDPEGGIVAVLVDEMHDVRDLRVAPPGKAPAMAWRARFTLPRGTRPGRCDVLVSVGDRIGTPRIALPLKSGDGRRRYRLGAIEVVRRGR